MVKLGWPDLSFLFKNNIFKQIWASLVAQLVKNPPAMWETCLGSIPGLGKPPGEGNSYPLQYSGLESPWGRKESDTTERLLMNKYREMQIIMK